MATWWIDYSAAKLTADVIKRTKIGPDGETASGAIRYLDAPDRLGRKHTSEAEYDGLLAGGLAMDAMFFEVDVDDPLGGFAQGQAYARRAQAGADFLGFDGVILFCCDRWFVSKNRRTITADVWQAYLDGAVSILGRERVGAYGFSDAMDAALGHVDYFVQCGSRSAVRSFVHAWQDNTLQPLVGGIETDRLLVLHPFTAGARNGGGSTPTTSTTGVDLMERITVTPPNAEQNTVRVFLPGTPGAAVIVRPRLAPGAKTAAKPMWVGDMFAWASMPGKDPVGIGHNPNVVPGYNSRLDGHRRYELPGALWADVVYSSTDPFEIDVVG
ncbi:hypothetical protein VA596_49875 [Amycolatopsis sp., V23-08]|uniref:Rv2525c-like glycoside hydrolase-like domain-containing protein n=1 Tax=Amycolatopsis heterodermiae TaxID=3110235 RepID=A0ABU5RPL6_9PSEU|nr:glycoside hydrolase domain-containing protein [Amycolatopsis sp., V23-08]MEA5367720.1 hypothetical protein [Amycolatopsis sp., V23-08]